MDSINSNWHKDNDFLAFFLWFFHQKISIRLAVVQRCKHNYTIVNIVIKRYERDEVKPSIQMAINIANVLNISLDYLVGKTNMELDATMLKRVETVSNLPQKEKETVFVFLDSFIDRMKLRGII